VPRLSDIGLQRSNVSNPAVRKSIVLYKDRPAAAPDAQAHWKLKPPKWPVTSTTSPMKNSPGAFRLSIVLLDSSSVSTPPAVTSAFSSPSVSTGITLQP